MKQTFLNHRHRQSTSQPNPGFEKHPGLAAPRGKKSRTFLSYSVAQGQPRTQGTGTLPSLPLRGGG